MSNFLSDLWRAIFAPKPPRFVEGDKVTYSYGYSTEIGEVVAYDGDDRLVVRVIESEAYSVKADTLRTLACWHNRPIKISSNAQSA